MDHLPIFLDLKNKACLVVGGGIVAERKTRLLLRSGARITVVAPELTERLIEQRDDGDIEHVAARFEDQMLEGRWLVIAATDDDVLNGEIAAAAERRAILCNVVDNNEASGFILPAIVDRSPVIVAIGTGGNAPVLAQQLKARIEAWLPPRIDELAQRAGRLRELVKKRFDTMRLRRRFWQRFFDGPIAEHILAGRQEDAEQAIRRELVNDADAAEDSAGEGWIVGAGPGDPGLVTLRAQQLISRADVVLYDRLVSSQVLDYARKEADLVFVGKRAGRAAMPQEEINALLVSLVAEGKRVCRLKGGDPFIFGRGGEEAAALAAAGLPFQVVPGISAALGCAAYAGIPLTLRGVSGSVTLATAKLDKDVSPDWPQLLKAGHTLSLYMGVGSVHEIVDAALANGVSADLPVAVVENGTTRQQRVVFTTVASLATDIARESISSPAIIYLGQAVNAARELQWFKPDGAEAGFSDQLSSDSLTRFAVANT